MSRYVFPLAVVAFIVYVALCLSVAAFHWPITPTELPSQRADRIERERDHFARELGR